MKNIETKRLILRNFQELDYDDLFELLSQRKDDLYEGYPEITYENGKNHLSYRLNNDEFYAIELKESHKVIGNVYFGNRNFNSKEIGYIINKNYQRKGYASEAIKEVINVAFFNDNIHRIFAECNPNNLCSWKLLESLSFRREAYFLKNVYFRKDEFNNPIRQDTLVYGLLNPKEDSK